MDEKKTAAFSYDVVGAQVCKSPGNGHLLAGKEYASAAAAEGFAHYYTALAFNDVRVNDCVIEAGLADFDGDGVADLNSGVWGGFTAYSCNDLPYWGSGGFTNITPTSTDNLGVVCDGVVLNRGTELDWLRFFWRLDTDQSLSFGEVLEVWDHANPHSWRPKDGGIQPFVWHRISGAGTGAGVGTEVASEGATNGVDRL